MKSLTLLTITLILSFLSYLFSLNRKTYQLVLILLVDLALKSSHSLFFKKSIFYELKLVDDPMIGLVSFIIHMKGTLVTNKIIIIELFWDYVSLRKVMFPLEKWENALRAF